MDSLFIKLSSVKEKNHEAELLYEVAVQYLKINLDSTEYYADKALKLSQKENLRRIEAESFWLFGKINIYKGKFNAALEHLRKAEKLFLSYDDYLGAAKSMNESGLCLMIIEKFDASQSALDSALAFAERVGDSEQIIRVNLNLSSVQFYQANFEGALSYLFKALEMAEQSNNYELQINALLNFGNFYSVRDDLDKSLEYFLKAAELIETKNGKVTQLHYCYNSIGSIFIKKKEPAKALQYALKAEKAAANINVKAGLMETYNVLGQSYMGLEEYDKAIINCKKALGIAEEINNPTMIALCTYNTGKAYSKSGEHQKSLNYLEKSLARFEKLDSQFQLAGNLLILAETHGALGNFRNAYLYQKRHDILQDSLHSERNEKLLKEVETEYKLKEKETQLELQAAVISEQKTFNYASGIIVSLLLAVIVLGFVNIKKEKRINIKLKELDETKSRFFSNISHEMRNPLTLIMGPLQELTKLTGNSAISSEIKLAYSNSKKLLEGVNSILDLSKLESGKMELIETPVVLHDLCKRILYSYQSLAQYRNINIKFYFEPDKSTTVLLDIEKFEKILNNLLLNAFKYSFSEGTITLQIYKQNNEFKFNVTDTGQGIHSEDLPNIFNRYYQPVRTDLPALGGSGIGLTLAKEYSKIFAGDILVKSNPGEGSTFTIILPLNETEEKPSHFEERFENGEEQADENKNYNSILLNDKKPEVLIVEDDLEMSRYLKEIMSANFSCNAVADGQQALNTLEKNKFDLILSDVMMPNMDGFEFRKKLRENNNLRQIPFVILTARSLEEDKIIGLKLGVDDYITKPFSPTELLARANNLIINKLERDNWLKENRHEEDSTETLSAEEEMLMKAEKLVLDNLDDPQFSVNELSSHLAYSLRQLERLLKKQTGLTPNAFIREIRLQKALKIIEQKRFTTIKEVCYDVGMSNPAYFSSKFKERFGKNPSEAARDRLIV